MRSLSNTSKYILVVKHYISITGIKHNRYFPKKIDLKLQLYNKSIKVTNKIYVYKIKPRYLNFNRIFGKKNYDR